jgi:hypothetical protein
MSKVLLDSTPSMTRYWAYGILNVLSAVPNCLYSNKSWGDPAQDLLLISETVANLHRIEKEAMNGVLMCPRKDTTRFE